MFRSAVILAMLLLSLPSPTRAQGLGGDALTWTSNRPDGIAPGGVTGASNLAGGQVTVSIGWQQVRSQGIWFQNDSVPLATSLQLYQVAPLNRSERRHTIEIAYGLFDWVTVRATGAFAFLDREQLTSLGVYYATSAAGLADALLDATFNLLTEGPYRVDVYTGWIVPLGDAETRAATPFVGLGEEELLPHDMRLGAGSPGLVLGASLNVQAEAISFGGQAKWTQYGESGDYTLGDRYEGSAWVAYNVTDQVSLSVGGRWQEWANIDGADPGLDPTRDPHSDPVFQEGRHVTVPIGVNLLGPAGSTVAGHRFALEVAYAVRRDYEGPQLGLDWTIHARYSVPF